MEDSLLPNLLGFSPNDCTMTNKQKRYLKALLDAYSDHYDYVIHKPKTSFFQFEDNKSAAIQSIKKMSATTAEQSEYKLARTDEEVARLVFGKHKLTDTTKVAISLRGLDVETMRKLSVLLGMIIRPRRAKRKKVS